MSLDKFGHIINEDFLQPGHERRFGAAAKLVEIPAGVQEGLLNQVGSIGPAAQMQIHLGAGQQLEIIAIKLQQFSQALPSPGLVETPPDLRDHLFGIGLHNVPCFVSPILGQKCYAGKWDSASSETYFKKKQYNAGCQAACRFWQLWDLGVRNGHALV